MVDLFVINIESKVSWRIFGYKFLEEKFIMFQQGNEWEKSTKYNLNKTLMKLSWVVQKILILFRKKGLRIN